MIARSRLEPANTDQAGSGAHFGAQARGLPVKAREPTPRLYLEIPCFQRLCVRNRGCTLCLPCRRSRVRIPSAAFIRVVTLRVLGVTRDVSSSARARV